MTDIKQLAEELLRLHGLKSKHDSLLYQNDKLRSEIDALKPSIISLNKRSTLLDKLLSLTKNKICKTCGGDGGWVVGDEFSGYDSGECEDCKGSGFIKL